jgi:hypothetical protein
VSRKPPVKPHAKSGGDDPPSAAADVPLANSQSYVALIADLKRRITDARLRAALSVNRELVLLYWSIGQDILSRQKSEGWGTKVIDRLAVDLGRAFPEMTGLSARNLKYMDFYESIYNITPAHADDVHAAIIENPDLEVIIPAGGERRKANTIGVNDIIKVKTQRSFFPMFLDAGTKGGSK